MYKKPTINEACVKTLKNTKREIKQSELVNKVCGMTGYTRQSVSGTLIGSAKGRLSTLPYFKRYWKATKDSRFVRKQYVKPGEEYVVDYNNIDKLRYMTTYISELVKLNIENPHILTLASSNANCVKEFNKFFPNCTIVNIERNKEVIKEFNKFNYKNVETFHGELSEFFKWNGSTFDFMNLDLMGYMSGSKVDTFKLINDNKPKLIALNMQYNKNPRNFGKFADFVKEKYKNYDDKIKECLCDIFYNYDLINEYVYNGSGNKNKMKNSIYKLKE